MKPEIHHVIATSFADPADVAAFRRAKSNGLSDREAFAFGDNGVGCWGDDTTDLGRPGCALPREDWKPFGKAARGRLVVVTVGNQSIPVELLDTMPARANIRNGAGIDLNPAACARLGLIPPVRVPASWSWAPEPVLADSPAVPFLVRIADFILSRIFRK